MKNQHQDQDRHNGDEEGDEEGDEDFSPFWVGEVRGVSQRERMSCLFISEGHFDDAMSELISKQRSQNAVMSRKSKSAST